MVDGDFLELAWKDGQLVMRGQSLSPSCISYSSHRSPASHQVKKEEMYPMHPAKRPNFKQAYSISDGNPLLDLPGALDKLGSAPTSGIPSGGNPHPLKTCRTYQLDEPNSKDQFQGSMGGLANSNLKHVGSSGPGKHFGFGNFSLFLRPAVLFKAYGQNNGATRPSNGRSSLRLEELRSNSNEKSAPVIGSSNHHVESSLMEPASSLEGPQDYLPGQPMATKTEPIAKPVEEPPPPDEQSENFVNRNDIASKRPSDQYFGLNSCSQADKIKGTPDMGKGIDNQLAGTTSICSRGASNDVTCSLRSRYEGIADASENVEEEQRRVKKLGGNKRKRTAEGHSLSEKKRREKINKRLRALQDLVPNSNKADKASMLDEAIEYIKTLQLQLQMMSVGSGLYNHMPPMMLTNGLRHLQAPQLAAPLHPVAAGFGVSIPMSTAPMVGLPGQMMMPMSTLSVAQSLPFIGGLQRQIPVPVPAGICSLDLLGSAPLLIGSKDNSNNAEKINPKVLNTLDSRIQASNQAIRGSSKH